MCPSLCHTYTLLRALAAQALAVPALGGLALVVPVSVVLALVVVSADL
jgi:hypothetical protein